MNRCYHNESFLSILEDQNYGESSFDLEEDIEIKQEVIFQSEYFNDVGEPKAKRLKSHISQLRPVNQSVLNTFQNISTCPKCSKVFISQEHLDIHSLSHAEGDQTCIEVESYECQINETQSNNIFLIKT